MFVLSTLRRDRGGKCFRSLVNSFQQQQQQNMASASNSLRAPAGDREDGGLNVMKSESSTANAWNSSQPKLGTWPNVEPGVPRPDVVQPPEPSIFVKEAKAPIVGGVSDATLISEYDRVKGTADLNDNANVLSGL